MFRRLTPLAGVVTFLLAWQIFVVALGRAALSVAGAGAIGRAFVDQLPILLSMAG